MSNNADTGLWEAIHEEAPKWRLCKSEALVGPEAKGLSLSSVLFSSATSGDLHPPLLETGDYDSPSLPGSLGLHGQDVTHHRPFRVQVGLPSGWVPKTKVVLRASTGAIVQAHWIHRWAHTS